MAGIKAIKARVLTPMLALYPRRPENVEAALARYIEHLKPYDEETLSAAWFRIEREHKYQSWPTIQALVAACEGQLRRRAPGPAGVIGLPGELGVCCTDRMWQTRLKYRARSGNWHADYWGPPPGAAGCCVPVELLQPEVAVGIAKGQSYGA